MQCALCNKMPATIHVLDLDEGEVVADQSLCPTCAESAGYVHAKAAPLKLSPEMLEDLIGGVGGPQDAESKERDKSEACPACGMTTAQFRAKGRLGCPRCYEMFRGNLLRLLEQVHDATSHRGRSPGKPARMAEAQKSADRVAELRSSLRDAIQAENYELAAELRDRIQKLTGESE